MQMDISYVLAVSTNMSLFDVDGRYCMSYLYQHVFLFYTDGKYLSKLYQEMLSYLNIVFFLSNLIYNHIGKLFHQILLFYINVLYVL